MFFPIPEPVRRQAKSPHEVAMVNLVLFNLLMLIALLGGSFVESDSSLAPYKILGVAVPLCISLAIVAYTWVRARRAARDGPWFLAAHWRLAGIRYRILLIAYLVGTGLIGLGWLLAHAQKSAGMQDLMFIALQRVAIAPMLITLMVLVMLESGAIYQAQRGEVPDGLVKRVPPPADLAGADAEFESAPPSA
ncbi:hypothetical protein [uncultured Lamprocystis sp.]|jgi:hypothetical protein|uniref:hypothetical protein n=1 Tax=uncultured Lamprocystis sp. TaxID=543132 RepID=UPI0025D9BA26|nr:hypothetical protein [uncultured Lamprocystis sp.]